MSKILVVENEETNMRLATEILTLHGHQVLQAWNGKEGIEKAMKELPTLILMDIELPVLNGMEAIRQIKKEKNTQNIPIIAVTANAMIGDEEMIRGVGADDYLRKPYEVKDLMALVNKYNMKRPSH